MARRNGEAIQHHFSAASWFLTVTPDDESNVLVQVYSKQEVDSDLASVSNIDELSDEDLVKRAIERTKIRIKFPGICAWVAI